jgi:hypothetical protein
MASHNRCERALPAASHAADSAAMQQTARRPVGGSITTAGDVNAKQRPTSVQFWSPFVDSFIWRQDMAPSEPRFDMNSTRSKACFSQRQHTSPLPRAAARRGRGWRATPAVRLLTPLPPPTSRASFARLGPHHSLRIREEGAALSLTATIALSHHGFAPSVCGANKRIEPPEGSLC